ncbi:hypothetical protein [Halopiger goleimassiliensis]|uniref:hypothetical protein n=1 Tax=Halopiger goleimassiliensis TaxID=1293048 RepID=UPI000677C67A|nr:hypothetical protein [Halopiger goleimassiliensis]
MGESFVTALRSEVASRGPLVLAVVLALLYFVFDVAPASLAIIAGTLFGLAVLEAARTSLGAPQYVSGLVVGASVAVGSAVTVVAVEFSWLLVAFAVAGGWLFLDALYDRRHGIDRSEPPADPMADYSVRESVAVMSDGRLLVAELRESPTPLSTAQLADRTAFSRDEVESILADLGDADPIERVGDDRYTVDEREMGASSLLRDAARRLLRPFSVLRPGR